MFTLLVYIYSSFYKETKVPTMLYNIEHVRFFLILGIFIIELLNNAKVNNLNN